jgi:ABC-type transport system involved in resistance to organic solvents, auxiliary component
MFNLFKKLSYFLIAGLVLGLTLTAHADEMAPDVLVKTTTQEVTTILKRDKSVTNDTQKLYALIDAKVLPHFDFNQMTMLAVGRYWRQATPAQQQAWLRSFARCWFVPIPMPWLPSIIR